MMPLNCNIKNLGKKMTEEEQKELNAALLEAAEKGKRSLARELIAEGAKTDGIDKAGKTPLYWAAHEGRAECVQMLIEAKADVNKECAYDYTPLYWAAYNGHKECLGLLIEAKADVNKVDKYTPSPLYCATHEGRAECVRLLIAAGVMIKEVDEYVQNLWCSHEKFAHCIKLLHLAKIADGIIDDNQYANPENIGLGQQELKLITERFGKLLYIKLQSLDNKEFSGLMLDIKKFICSDSLPKELSNQLLQKIADNIPSEEQNKGAEELQVGDDVIVDSISEASVGVPNQDDNVLAVAGNVDAYFDQAA